MEVERKKPDDPCGLRTAHSNPRREARASCNLTAADDSLPHFTFRHSHQAIRQTPTPSRPVLLLLLPRWRWVYLCDLRPAVCLMAYPAYVAALQASA